VKRRWRLITLVGLLALLGGMSALQHRAAYSSAAGGPTQVAIVQVGASWPVSDAETEAAVRQAVALAGGLEDIVGDGDTVVVKPNLYWNAPPDEGAVTDPRVARTVVQLALEAGAGEVIVAEGSGCYYNYQPNKRHATDAAFRDAGYDVDEDMVDDVTGAQLVDLNDAGGLDEHDSRLVREVHLRNGLIWSDYWLPNVILDADVLIGVPVLKNHHRAGVTLALKNQIGIAPSDIYHRSGSKMYKMALGHGPDDLGRHIVDLNLARPLDFVIVDGLRGMTDGPTGGTLADPPMRLIIAGPDAVAVDTIGTLVMGYDPQSVPYLGWAAGAGLGTDDVAQITVRGLPVGQVRRDFPAPYGDTPTDRAEATDPSVDIATPGEATIVLDRTAVRASASDDAAVAKVEFYAGDELQAIVAAPPYQATLDLSAHRGQTVTLRAVAYDRALNDAEAERTVAVIPAPAPGAATLTTATLAIPTYPYADFLHSRLDPQYNITYRYLDRDAYENSHPTPSLQEYTLLVLENDYLQVTLLPELGGRVYQMTYKPTGHNELYQNPVIKPTRWGYLSTEENWWLGVGGIEWCLPVEEHGYEWGEPWEYEAIASTAGVTVTLRDTSAADRIRAAIIVHLPSSRGMLAITPRIENPTGEDIDFKYWTNAMLTPGAANTVGADLHFILGADQVTVHSSGDFRVGKVLDWPIHGGRDTSRLGTWNHWLGVFERPQAAADFSGVYDTGADEGVARVFPPEVATGSKAFGFGWERPIDPDTWTDDGSAYVELHGGVAPTFWDTAAVTAGHALEWTELWYPVDGIGRLSAATDEAALGVRESGGSFCIGVHSTAPRAAGASTLTVWDRLTCAELAHWELADIAPGNPFTETVGTGGRTLDNTAFVYLDSTGKLLGTVNPRDCLPPTSTVEPLPAWVGTTAFTVRWSGQDIWTGIAAYDVQVRDGYEGTWTDWLSGTTATSGTFAGSHGHTYLFRARARDQEGNQEPFGDEEWGQTFTTVLTEPAPVLVTSVKSATPRYVPADQPVAYAIAISNTGNLAATAVLTDTPPAQMLVLTKTLAATGGMTPTYLDGQILWSGTVEADAEVRVTYKLSPTATTPMGVPLTNTAEITGSVLGAITRQATVVRTHQVWLPLAARAWAP